MYKIKVTNKSNHILQMFNTAAHSPPNVYVCCIRADRRNGRCEPVTIHTCTHNCKYCWLVWSLMPYFHQSLT